jgi:hypothetical protein
MSLSDTQGNTFNSASLQRSLGIMYSDNTNDNSDNTNYNSDNTNDNSDNTTDNHVVNSSPEPSAHTVVKGESGRSYKPTPSTSPPSDMKYTHDDASINDCTDNKAVNDEFSNSDASTKLFKFTDYSDNYVWGVIAAASISIGWVVVSWFRKK